MQLKEIMEKKDYKIKLESSSNLGNNPSRATIEALFAEHGIDLPTFDVTFYLFDSNGHNQQVNYLAEKDAYFLINMSEVN